MMISWSWWWFFSCPEQLIRWPCHWLTDWMTHHYHHYPSFPSSWSSWLNTQSWVQYRQEQQYKHSGKLQGCSKPGWQIFGNVLKPGWQIFCDISKPGWQIFCNFLKPGLQMFVKHNWKPGWQILIEYIATAINKHSNKCNTKMSKPKSNQTKWTNN